VLTDRYAIIVPGALPAEILPALHEGYQEGFRYLFFLNAALATFSCFAALWLIPHHSVDRHDDQALREEAAARMEQEKKRPEISDPGVYRVANTGVSVD
jgi:hypothetical protein